MAAEWKEKGNSEFSSGNYEKAIEYFTKAISIDPNDHVFYSNRSACYSSQKDYAKALEDAEKCISLKPDWVRGYTRKGLAEFYLENYDKAIETYEAGLKLDPNNQQLKDGLEQARNKQKEASNPMAGLLSDANIEKLRTHPKTAHYFLQQDFVSMVQLIKTNPNLMQMMFQDPRFTDCLSVLLGFDMNSPPSYDKEPSKPSEPKEKFEPRQEQKEEKKPEKEETKENQAEKLKELGNAAYKKKDWAAALDFYEKALEINPQEVTYINNKAAVYFAMKEYQKCIEICEEAVVKSREYRADLSKVARALSRKGLALEQLGDLEGAINATKASLMEFKDDKVKFTLRDLEKLKKKKDEESYVDAEKAEENNNKGNELFKQGNFPGALLEYEEALRRNPKSAKIYSNKAACLIKLMEFSRALTDINKALELEPNYVKALLKKGNIHYLLKEYHKSLETYQKVLGLEPDNVEARDGYQKTMFAVNNSTGQPDDERIRHAMADPEIQSIMRDPTIQQVLKDLQENPQASQGYLKDPKIMAAISKLAAAGILRLG